MSKQIVLFKREGNSLKEKEPNENLKEEKYLN
jgi:hypothetical protein